MSAATVSGRTSVLGFRNRKNSAFAVRMPMFSALTNPKLRGSRSVVTFGKLSMTARLPSAEPLSTTMISNDSRPVD